MSIPKDPSAATVFGRQASPNYLVWDEPDFAEETDMALAIFHTASQT